jgi:hypothetical protein
MRQYCAAGPADFIDGDFLAAVLATREIVCLAAGQAGY